MPYIIETRTPARDRILGKQWHHVDRTAVATLDEAREFAAEVQSSSLDSESYNALQDEAHRLPNSGGTIGPLPDGTVIEVWRVDTGELENALDPASIPFAATPIDIVAAFNAHA